MSPSHSAILYSFRRCPYAMRARLAIWASQQSVEIREVLLRDKPAALRQASAKATVPVLILPKGQIIDESLDIMLWALQCHDPLYWLQGLRPEQYADSLQLISNNDTEFKYYLDRYKYADRYPEHSQLDYRQQAETFLAELEQRLEQQSGLINDKPCFADMAIAPFIRQFAFVDQRWFFEQAPYPALRHWLQQFLDSEAFTAIMAKLPAWQPGDPPRHFSG